MDRPTVVHVDSAQNLDYLISIFSVAQAPLQLFEAYMAVASAIKRLKDLL